MAEIRINHAQAHRFATTVAEKQIRRAMLEIKLGAVQILATGPYTHGVLAADLKVKVTIEPTGSVLGRIGSSLSYAAAVHDGAEPHYIFPHPPKTRLKFFWRKRGKVVAPPFVYHPGQHGKHYLTKPLFFVASRYRMLVFTYHHH